MKSNETKKALREYNHDLGRIFDVDKSEIDTVMADIKKDLDKIKDSEKFNTIKKGYKKGAIAARQDDIIESLRILNLIDRDLIRIIKKQKDMDILKIWFSFTLNVDSMEDVKNTIK